MATWMGTVNFTETSYYNFSDFNRENNNVQYLQEKLAAYGYGVTLPYPIQVVTRTDFPTVSRINQTKSNIIALMNKLFIPTTLAVDTSRKQRFDYIAANKLEINIKLIYDGFDLIAQSWRYCGTFSCGEEGLL